MSSLKVSATSLFRTTMTAMLDAIASTGIKAVIAPIEDKTKSPEHLASQCVIDEGPETFWKGVFGSILAKLKNNFAPNIPEQFVNIPGDLLGAFVHWKSAAHQSLDRVATLTKNKLKSNGKLIDKFFDACIKCPTNFILKLVGFNKEENKLNFARFGIANIGAFILGTLALKGSDSDNMPGVNLSSNEPALTSFLKTIGYTITEQITHIGSQWMRYYQNYNEDFGNHALAKSLANVVNEKTFPGNILSALGACLATLWFGDYIPKSACGALGEVIPKGFTRLLETRLRRSTKDKYDETSENKRAPNYRFHDVKWFNKMLDTFDYVFVKLRKLTIDHVVAPIFKPQGLSLESFKKELTDSFDISLDVLKARTENKALPLQSGKVFHINGGHVPVNSQNNC